MTVGEQGGALEFLDGPQGRTVVVNSVWNPSFADRVKRDRETSRMIYSPGRDTECDLAFLTDLRKLTEIVGLSGASRLRVLDLAGCAALPAMTEVGTLTQLTRLHISLRGEVPSIEPLANCRRLETLSIENTRIADGKIAFLLDLPGLTDPYIAPTKGYDMTNSELRRRAKGK